MRSANAAELGLTPEYREWKHRNGDDFQNTYRRIQEEGIDLEYLDLILCHAFIGGQISQNEKRLGWK